MAGFDVNGIGGSQPGPSGLFMALDPQYQLQQAAVRRANAFQGGVPRDATGNLDIGAVRDKLLEVGDYGDAANFLTTDLQQQSLAAAMRNAGSVGQYGGGQANAPAGAPGGLLAGLAPAAGGGMIATGAGGDDYGRLPAPAAAPGGRGGTSAAMPGDYLSRLASVESGGDDNAPASGSSAFGRYRFTSSTWAGLAKEYPQLGLTADGRSDPGQQQRAVLALTNDNASALGRAGFQPTPGNLRLAHFAGAAGATAVLDADPRTPVSSLLGASAVQANPFLDGMTAGGLVGWANKQMANVDPSTVPGSPGGMSPDVASALVRLRAGQSTPQDRAAFGAYQAGRAQGRGAVVSFGGAATAGDGSQPTAPIGDDDAFAAESRLRAGTGTDADRALRSAYLGQQNARVGEGTVHGAPSPAPDAPAPTGSHPFAPGGGALKSAPGTPPAGGSAGPIGAGGGQGGGFQPVSFGGPGGDTAAPRPPTVAGTSPLLATIPPDAVAAVGRLRSGQGSPADAATWGTYMKSVGGVLPAGQAQALAAAFPPYGAPPVPRGTSGRLAPVPTQPTTPPPGLLDPSLGGQVPDDWLKAGFSPGGWVNYARQQAALNGNLPFGAGKANQDAWNAIAASAAQTIDRSLQFTPEQKNARDPLAVQYERDRDTFKAQTEQAARLAADTDPSRVTFAGDEARARAAGTAAYDLVPTQPTPGGPTVYRSKADVVAGDGGPAVKDQPAYFGQKQEALGKLDGEMQSQFQNRQVAQERLDAMANLLETFQSGAGADAKAAAVAAVRAAGFNVPDNATASPAAVEQFSKNATANIFANAKDFGGRVLVTELQGLAKSNANPNMQPASNAAIIAQQKGLLNWENQHYADYSAWRQANPNATDASAFEQSWAKANPVGAYVAAARKDIAPLGAPLPPQGQLADGQAYMVKGQKVRWSAASGQFVPFSGTTAPALPGQAAQGGVARQAAGGQGQGAPPVSGARQARDGQWYVSDPSRPGKFLQVVN